MAAKKVYAVRKGKVKGIFFSWEDCKGAVDGVPGAEYKGFSSLPEAMSYMEETAETAGKSGGGTRSGNPVTDRSEAKGTAKANGRESGETGTRSRKKAAVSSKGRKKGGSGSPDSKAAREAAVSIRPDAPDKLLAYVDGSYDHSLKKYAFGCVFILPDGTVYTDGGNGDNPQSLALRNVTGEMLGAMFAVRFAMHNGFRQIEIRYDYEGIEKWVTGAWRSKTELTQKYAASMRSWGQSIHITFRKVTAHTNVYYNEMADQLAKAALSGGNGVPKVRGMAEMEPYVL